MDYEHLKKLVIRSGLTNKELAKLLNVNENSISNLAGKDKVPNHYAVIAVLISLLAKNDIEFKNELEKLDLKQAKPRGKSFKPQNKHL